MRVFVSEESGYSGHVAKITLKDKLTKEKKERYNTTLFILATWPFYTLQKKKKKIRKNVSFVP